MRNYILDRVREAEEVRSAIANSPSILAAIETVTDHLAAVIQAGGSIFFCGNGGSAADAQHLATELSGRFFIDRKAIRAEALGTNMAFATAIANDYDFSRIYARSLEALGSKGDALVLLSTSGSSPNIIAAAKQAQEMQVSTVGLTGLQGTALTALCDYSIIMPSKSVPRIQEAYMLVGHIMCEHLENTLF